MGKILTKPGQEVRTLHGSGAESTVSNLNLALESAGLLGQLCFQTTSKTKAQAEVWLDSSAGFFPQAGCRQILNLQDAGLVQASVQVSQDLYWLCMGDPRRILGSLWDHLQGAYLGDGGQDLVVASKSELLILPYMHADAVENRKLQTLASLALVLAGTEAGINGEDLCKILEYLRTKMSSHLTGRAL